MSLSFGLSLEILETAEFKFELKLGLGKLASSLKVVCLCPGWGTLKQWSEPWHIQSDLERGCREVPRHLRLEFPRDFRMYRV